MAFAALTLREETVVINRLVIGECDRFPKIAATFYEAAIRRTNSAMENWLRRQCERGLMRLEDPQAASGMLRGMMITEPQRAAMMRQRTVPDAEQIARRAKLAAQIFLNGCRAWDQVQQEAASPPDVR